MAANREARLQFVAPPVAGPPKDERLTFALEVVDACRQVAPAGLDPTASQVTAARLLGMKIRPAFAEAFRLLALNVREMAASRQLQSILVMSAAPGEGRTLTVASLGIALAELGSRVVLVASDSRGPGLGRLIRVEQPAGDPAVGDPGPAGVGVVSTGVTGLVLVRPPRGGPATGPGVVVEPVLTALRPIADFVLLDSPPCQRYADAFFLASLVDGVLCVVRRRPQDLQALRAVQAQLGRLGAKLLGVVHNEG